MALPGGQLVEMDDTRGLVVPNNDSEMPRLWGRAMARGVAAGRVHLGTDGGPVGTLYLFDLRAGHGVMVAVFVEGDAEAEVLEVGRRPDSLQPRFARVWKDAGSIILAVGPALPQILGWSAEEMVGRRTTEFVHPDDHEAAVANWLDMLDEPGPGRALRIRFQHRDGHWVWFEVTNTNRLADPQHADVVAEMIDVSEEMAVQETLRAREQLLAQLTESVPVGLFHADEQGRLVFANPGFRDLTGVSGLLSELAARGGLDGLRGGVARCDGGRGSGREDRRTPTRRRGPALLGQPAAAARRRRASPAACGT